MKDSGYECRPDNMIRANKDENDVMDVWCVSKGLGTNFRAQKEIED